MAAKLLGFYEEAKKLGGLKAQMRLAVLTGMPGTKAGAEPDSPDNVSRFERAMKEIRTEFH